MLRFLREIVFSENKKLVRRGVSEKKKSFFRQFKWQCFFYPVKPADIGPFKRSFFNNVINV